MKIKLSAITISLLLLSTSAFAGTKINLASNSQTTVKNDLYTANCYYEAQGTSSTEVAQRTNEVIKRGWEVAQEPGVDTKISNISMSPQYKNNGKIGGWTMRAELSLESKKADTMSKLISKLQETLMVSQIGSHPSEELRKEAEEKATTVAIELFQSKAKRIADQFGKNYKILTMDINNSGSIQPIPITTMARAESFGAANEITQLPIEAHDTVVHVAVHGQIELDD